MADREYDLVVVGGGIFGVCAAWDAALRGLSVAIVERGDFCQATSANHFKVVHGGIRYLQHLDLHRIRESSRERSALLRIAPHLVQPLPIIVPTYGHGKKGKEFLEAGLFLYDVLTLDRNTGLRDPGRQIPGGRVVSRKEVLELCPGIKEKGLTGGAIFWDGQIFNPPRLVLSFLRSAVNKGADAANYVVVTDFLKKGDRVFGVQARNILTGDQLEIRGKVVLNTAGPWAHHLLERALGVQLNPKPIFSRDLALVINRRAIGEYGIGFPTNSKDTDSILDRGGRHLFVMPWREMTLIGVWHAVFNGPPEKISVTEAELQGFLDEVNKVNPDLALRIDDISMVNTGLTLFGDEKKQDLKNLSFGKRSRLIDHRRQHGIEGLVTLIGVRFTTARGMAEKAVNLAFEKLGIKVPRSITSSTRIYGGQIGCFEEYLESAIGRSSQNQDARVTTSLVRNYGSKYSEVLKYIDEEPSWHETLGKSKVLKAEAIHAIREEMAQKLTDVVFRRTDLGTAGYPGEKALQMCANLMASEMDWNSTHVKREVQEVKSAFPPINQKY